MKITKVQENGDKIIISIIETDIGELVIRDAGFIPKGKRKEIPIWKNYSFSVTKDVKIKLLKKQLNIETDDELQAIISDIKAEYIEKTKKRLELTELRF